MTTISNINQVVQQADNARETHQHRGLQEAGQMPAATPQEKAAAQGTKIRHGSGAEKTGEDKERRRNQGRGKGKRGSDREATSAENRRGTGTLLDTVA